MPAPQTKTMRSAAGVTAALTALFLLSDVVRVFRTTGGWTYSLDDAYIHLAIADTLRNHGVWGLTPADAAGASSSPLWTLLLATFGAPEWFPLVLNFLLVTLGAAWLAGVCARQSGSAWTGIVFGIAAVLLTNSLRAMAAGMEHLFHGLLSALFLGACLRAAYPEGERAGRGPLLMIGGLAALAIVCRAESLMVVGIGGLTLVAFRRWPAVLATVAGALIGLGTYAAIGAWQRIPAVPNSVALKVLETGGSFPFGRLRLNLLHQTTFAVMALIALVGSLTMVVAMVRNRRATAGQVGILMATALVWGHLVLAKITHPGRYEVYMLVVLGALALPEIAARLHAENPQRRRNLAFVVVPVLAMIAIRPALLLRVADAARWSEEINASPREMERFVQQALPQGTVMLNDVGAVSYYTHARVLDLWGLGNNEVCRERLRVGGVPSPEWIEGFARREHADLAMVFDVWFDIRGSIQFRTPGRGLPRSWTKIGEFRLRGKREVVGGDAVSVYVVRPEKVPGLRAKFAAFRSGSSQDELIPF